MRVVKMTRMSKYAGWHGSADATRRPYKPHYRWSYSAGVWALQGPLYAPIEIFPSNLRPAPVLYDKEDETGRVSDPSSWVNMFARRMRWDESDGFAQPEWRRRVESEREHLRALHDLLIGLPGD